MASNGTTDGPQTIREAVIDRIEALGGPEYGRLARNNAKYVPGFGPLDVAAGVGVEISRENVDGIAEAFVEFSDRTDVEEVLDRYREHPESTA